MFRILEGHGMAPPHNLDAVPASVRAHSTLLRAMGRAGTLECFDECHAVRLAQARPGHRPRARRLDRVAGTEQQCLLTRDLDRLPSMLGRLVALGQGAFTKRPAAGRSPTGA